MVLLLEVLVPENQSGELGRFSVVYMDCALQSLILINYLVLIRHTADSIGSFPSRRQLGRYARAGW